MVASMWKQVHAATTRLSRTSMVLGIALVTLLALMVSQAHPRHNFRAIREGHVYASGVIPPEELQAYVERYGIRTVIDLRDPTTHDKTNNPELAEAITRERSVIAGLAGVRHVHLPTDQVPTQDTVDRFLATLDKPSSYPVLIHCHHGVGRAALFSALYRIEYEGLSNAQARAGTRWLPGVSSFAEHRPKGAFLMQYRPRHAATRPAAGDRLDVRTQVNATSARSAQSLALQTTMTGH